MRIKWHGSNLRQNPDKATFPDIVNILNLSSIDHPTNTLAGLWDDLILILQWLNGYPFRVQLTWWQLILPVVTLILIALATTFWLTFKAALTNPTASLKDE